MQYDLCAASDFGHVRFENGRMYYVADRDMQDGFFSLTLSFPHWEEDAYILLPACAYNGNRFQKLPCKYPPMYPEEVRGETSALYITDVPALNPDGSGQIEVTTGDLSVPCYGVFFPPTDWKPLKLYMQWLT